MSEPQGEEVDRGQEAPGVLPRARRELKVVLQPARHNTKSANSLMHLQVFPQGINLRLGTNTELLRILIRFLLLLNWSFL